MIRFNKIFQIKTKFVPIGINRRPYQTRSGMSLTTKNVRPQACVKSLFFLQLSFSLLRKAFNSTCSCFRITIRFTYRMSSGRITVELIAIYSRVDVPLDQRSVGLGNFASRRTGNSLLGSAKQNRLFLPTSGSKLLGRFSV
jgi:hypothetical protein